MTEPQGSMGRGRKWYPRISKPQSCAAPVPNLLGREGSEADAPLPSEGVSFPFCALFSPCVRMEDCRAWNLKTGARKRMWVRVPPPPFSRQPVGEGFLAERRGGSWPLSSLSIARPAGGRYPKRAGAVRVAEKNEDAGSQLDTGAPSCRLPGPRGRHSHHRLVSLGALAGVALSRNPGPSPFRSCGIWPVRTGGGMARS